MGRSPLGAQTPRQDRLQADPMFVHRPTIPYDGVRMFLFFFSGHVLQFFLARRGPAPLQFWDGAASVFGWNI